MFAVDTLPQSFHKVSPTLESLAATTYLVKSSESIIDLDSFFSSLFSFFKSKWFIEGWRFLGLLREHDVYFKTVHVQ